MQRDDTRYMAGLNAHYDVADWVRPYIQFGFMDDRTHQEVAPSALFRGQNPNNTNSGNYYVNCGNPFLSAQQLGILGCTPAQINAVNQLDLANQVEIEIGRRNVEGGNRVNDYNHTNYRAVVGARGDFAPGWSYDAYGQFYYVTYFGSSDKYMNYANISNALLVTRGAGGTPVCVSGGPTCVPYNIFQDGGVTQDALTYLQTVGTQRGESTLRTYHVDVPGELGEYGLKSPTAREGLAINVGLEHRNENVTLTPDSVERSGQLAGFGSAVTPIDASQSVDEQFIELRAPLVQD